MIEQVLNGIVLKNEQKFMSHLNQCLTSIKRLNSMEVDHAVYELQIQKFLRGLGPLLSEFKNKDRMSIIINLIKNLFAFYEYELEPEECYILYHLKDLGKFRIKDDTLFNDLQKSWKEFPDYELEKSDFKDAVKGLKNVKLIDSRKGSITMSMTHTFH